MREKIINAIALIKQDYYNGNINSTECHEQLNGLKNTVFEMERYRLIDDLNLGKIQNLIYQEQDRLGRLGD